MRSQKPKKSAASLSSLRQRLCCAEEDACREAFERVFERLGAPIFRFVSGMIGDASVAHDLTQETFMRLWESREKMEEVRSLKAYVFQIARNRVYSYQRSSESRFANKENREERTSGTFDLDNRPRDLPSAGPEPDRKVGTQEVLENLRGWIADLPERQREALLLAREQGLSHDEIAAVMEISVNTVNNHIVKATSKLKEHLESFRPDLI